MWPIRERNEKPIIKLQAPGRALDLHNSVSVCLTRARVQALRRSETIIRGVSLECWFWAASSRGTGCIRVHACACVRETVIIGWRFY